MLAPVGEEVFFRGYVFRYLLEGESRRAAYLISALLFAGAHLYLPALPVYLLLALVFAWLTERTGSVLRSMTAHATVNASALILAFLELR